MELAGTFWNLITFKDIVDILIVTVFIYQIIMIAHGTRAVQTLLGVAALGILFWMGISYKLHALNWLLAHFFDSFFIIFIILFQDQIRTALTFFGSSKKFFGGRRMDSSEQVLDEIVEACGAMGKKKIGALIVIERTNGLRNYIATGTLINGKLHSDLIYSIFESSSSLHDGAIIVTNGMIGAAGCFLPLSKNSEIDRNLGTRHRAALGLTEVTDSVTITVSEETGGMSVCQRGKFYAVKSEKQLRQYLRYLYSNKDLDEVTGPVII